jgi:hypothetical protein
LWSHFYFTKTLHHILARLKASYTLDIRALGLMRIGIGLILLTDLYIRALSITAFFTDEGVLPISILKQYNWSPTYFSFHALNGDLWWQVVMFILNALCVVLLIIGYRTRLFTFICWVLLTSLQNRNPFILQGGDDLLRIILFWAIFLPWGERFSIQKKSNYTNNYFSWANIGYLILPCSVLFFSAILKTSPEWHSQGTALYYALSLDQIRMPGGTFIYQFPNLLKGLTYMVYYIELLAPLLIVMPFVSTKIRMIGIISIIALFIGIACTLYVGLFYIIGIVSVIGLMPSTVIDWFESHFYKNKTQFVEMQFQEQKIPFIINVLYTLKNYFIILIISFCLLMNLGGIKNFPYALDSKIVTYGKVLRLEQSWGMFSPYILKDDGWFVYSGYHKTKGKYIDIKNNKDFVSFKKPTPIINEFESDRWRKFQENYTFNNNNYMRPFYCKYLINTWNKKHPKDSISDLTIFFMKETSLPDYQTKPLVKIAVCNCQDK